MRRSAAPLPVLFRVAYPLVAAAVAAAQPPAAGAQVPPDVPEVLRSGDVVQVEVWRQPEFSGEFRVTSSGTIAHPLYREIEVAGRPVAEVEEELRKFLGGFEANPNFVVEALFRVAVGGEVREPSVHPLPPGTTVAEVVALTGGITERGRLNAVLLRRDGEEYELDLSDPREGLRDVTIRSGDEIVVQRRRDFFRDYLAPASSVMGALLTLTRVLNIF